MFYDIALAYFEISERSPLSLYFVTAALAALVPMILLRTAQVMSRASYFAASNIAALLVIFCFAAVNWHGDAVFGDFWLYLVLASYLVMPVLIGLIVGWFSIERARDAFGNRFAALVAFVPILNLSLLLTKGEDVDQSFRFRWLANWVGVLIGFACIFLTRILAQQYVPPDFNAKVAAAIENNVEFVVALTAAEAVVPEVVTPYVTIVDVQASGRELTYVYEVLPSLLDEINLSPVEPDDPECLQPEIRSLLSKGVTVINQYRASGREEVTFVYSSQTCGL